MSTCRVLVVDDEPAMLQLCAQALSKLGEAEVVLAPDGELAAAVLERDKIDLLVTDIRMPGYDGLQLAQVGRRRHPQMSLVVMTGFPKLETAIQGLRLGASEYLTKPFDPDELLGVAKRLLETRGSGKQTAKAPVVLDRPQAEVFEGMVGRCLAMQRLFETIQRVAPRDIDVVVSGESGTGKELVARAIHRCSARRGEFVPVNCGAIPKDLMESDFFGHARGAFTGAHAESRGLLGLAVNGTLFLDEIHELPVELQTKLLRVIQERTMRPVGCAREIQVSLRIIAASSIDLAHRVKLGAFREDLYFRINVVQIKLPPLRERGEDILLLADRFCQQLAKEMQSPLRTIAPEAKDAFLRYDWPGNVRQLENVIKRDLALSDCETLLLSDLPEDLLVGNPSSAGGQPDQSYFGERERYLTAFNRKYLRELLQACGGDVRKASRKADLPSGTLYRLLKTYYLSAADFRGGNSPQQPKLP